VWDSNNDGRRSGVFVNTGPQPRTLVVSDPKDCGQVLRLDTGTGGRVVREAFRGTINLDGYGIAVLSNAAWETEID
jgi:hypothetical protein